MNVGFIALQCLKLVVSVVVCIGELRSFLLVDARFVFSSEEKADLEVCMGDLYSLVEPLHTMHI
jgi:hypothetical protein